MRKITAVDALEVLDSRGTPTIQVMVTIEGGIVGAALVPSGASTGEHEAIELRDQENTRYGGKGVQNAVSHVQQELSQVILGENVLDQRKLDQRMIEVDGTGNKSRLGANAILGVSLALARAAAQSENVPLYRYLMPREEYILPCPMMNVINGGMHADNLLEWQEFMIRPVGACSFAEGLRWGSEIFQQLKKVLQSRGFSVSVGDEGGFAPQISSHKEALDILVVAVEKAGYRLGDQIRFALDIAASSFYDKTRKSYIDQKAKKAPLKERTMPELLSLLQQIATHYPVDSIEDGMDETDYVGWQNMTHILGDKVQIVGDDLFVTNRFFLQRGIEEKMGNAILIKPNQVGTLTETLDCIELAKKHHYGVIISHRSGETEDPFIADLAVAVGEGQIKTGSLCRSERVAKYNRLLYIEKELGDRALYRDGNRYRGI